MFTFPGLVRFKNVSARSTALRSLLFFSPELTSRDGNVLQRSADETSIVRRVLVGDATLFMQAPQRAGSVFVWAVFAKRRGSSLKKNANKEPEHRGWFCTLIGRRDKKISSLSARSYRILNRHNENYTRKVRAR